MLNFFTNNSFFKLMHKQPRYSMSWFKLAFLFKRNWLNNNEKGESRIPKKIHLVWLGSETPAEAIELLERWKEIHPDWVIKIWTDKDAEEFKMRNYTVFKNLKNYGAKSDIFRYEILYREGGLYIDTDFECVKSMNDFLHLNLFCGTGWVKKVEVINAIFGCEPKHPFLGQLIENIAKSNIDESSFDKILDSTGPRFFTKNLLDYTKKNKHEKIVIFPTEFFYAFPPKLRHEIRNYDIDARKKVLSFVKENTYCMHLWRTSWQKK
jgi:mannosyltransferase OCH1-like enzyme